jgi:hypothetical protein
VINDWSEKIDEKFDAADEPQCDMKNGLLLQIRLSSL